MFQDALAGLLQKKAFDKISIQDIAEASTLNRATFWDHYPDKFALLKCMVASRFEQMIAERQITFDGCEGAVRNVSMGVCYYLAEMPASVAGDHRQTAAPLVTAIVSVIRKMILEGFSQHPPTAGISAELLSSTIAWAIYGAASDWANMADRIPVPEIAQIIEQMITPMFVSASTPAGPDPVHTHRSSE